MGGYNTLAEGAGVEPARAGAQSLFKSGAAAICRLAPPRRCSLSTVELRSFDSVSADTKKALETCS